MIGEGLKALNREKTEEGYKRAMVILNQYSKQQNYSDELAFKLRKIMREENHFLVGYTEVIKDNLDFNFRLLYPAAYLLLLSSLFID